MAELGTNLNIICLESEAFYRLIDKVVERLAAAKPNDNPPQWVNDTEAMKLLGVSSRTTLQKYRDEGRIKFTQPSRKVILYERASILEYLERHAKEPFQ